MFAEKNVKKKKKLAVDGRTERRTEVNQYTYFFEVGYKYKTKQMQGFTYLINHHNACYTTHHKYLVKLYLEEYLK